MRAAIWKYYLELPMRGLQQLLCLFPGAARCQNELINHHLFSKCVHFLMRIGIFLFVFFLSPSNRTGVSITPRLLERIFETPVINSVLYDKETTDLNAAVAAAASTERTNGRLGTCFQNYSSLTKDGA